MKLELELELKIQELELELNWKNGIDPNPGDKASNVKNRTKTLYDVMHVGQGMPNKVSYRPPDMIDHRTLDDTYTLDGILDEGSKFQNRMFISFPQFVYCSRDEVYFPKLSCLIASCEVKWWRHFPIRMAVPCVPMGTIQRLLCITFMTSQSHLWRYYCIVMSCGPCMVAKEIFQMRIWRSSKTTNLRI